MKTAYFTMTVRERGADGKADILMVKTPDQRPPYESDRSKIIDLDQWKSSHVLPNEQDEIERQAASHTCDGATSVPGLFHAILQTAELLTTLAIIGAMVVLIIKILVL